MDHFPAAHAETSSGNLECQARQSYCFNTYKVRAPGHSRRWRSTPSKICIRILTSLLRVSGMVTNRHTDRERRGCRNMESYDRFVPFYDTVMGDRKESAQRLLSFVRTHNPKARKILELACGTGSVLQHFGKRRELYGLDLSSKMLAVAKRKVPRATLSRQDMTSFRLSEKFDVIFCVYDSINHVLSFSGWTKVFATTPKPPPHRLTFLFHINT